MNISAGARRHRAPAREHLAARTAFGAGGAAGGVGGEQHAAVGAGRGTQRPRHRAAGRRRPQVPQAVSPERADTITVPRGGREGRLRDAAQAAGVAGEREGQEASAAADGPQGAAEAPSRRRPPPRARRVRALRQRCPRRGRRHRGREAGRRQRAPAPPRGNANHLQVSRLREADDAALAARPVRALEGDVRVAGLAGDDEVFAADAAGQDPPRLEATRHPDGDGHPRVLHRARRRFVGPPSTGCTGNSCWPRAAACPRQRQG